MTSSVPRSDSLQTIAVIDDDDSVRTAITRLLRAFGFTAVAFASAEAFLDASPSGMSVIVSDIQMTGMTGIALKSTLDAGGSTAPVILMTARNEPGLLQQAANSGAFCVLHKPFDGEAFIACIERALAA